MPKLTKSREIEKDKLIVSIPLNEPSNFRYIRIHPATNHVHLLVPIISGLDISTDNTCKSEVELKAFFEGGAFKELESYKSTLEFHLSLLEEGDARYLAKKERLAQINVYLNAVTGMRDSYKKVVNTALVRPSNLYSIQLRPRNQDPYSNVVNPVFTINRSNDFLGNPLSALYNKMHEVFPAVTFGRVDPREALVTKVLTALSQDASFENIQEVLAVQCTVPEDFFKKRFDARHQKLVVDKTYVDRLMDFDDTTTPKEYVEALLGLCAPSLETTLQGSPFYLKSSVHSHEKTEHLSMLTQFYLGVLNVYCKAHNISDKNFGKVLDDSPGLSQALVHLVAETLRDSNDVELALIAFFNRHQADFQLSRELTPEDKNAIQQKFETTYRTVTATKENPHMDDFMLLDTEAHGTNDIFITSNGLIGTDFSHIVPITSETHTYFTAIRHEAHARQDMVRPQDEPMTTVDIAPELLMDKLSDVQWDRLPQEVINACHALPAFKVRALLDDVAKGKQAEANTILKSAEDKQALLKTSGKFTDYSGRTFHCTAYEYAYWAKDTHMQRMLERHMDDDTKALMLDKVNEIERSGLAYQQHGLSYKNAHYDMSFILKDLSVDEFHRLKTMLGQRHNKLNTATAENYKTVSFTATEYEQLKEGLAEQHKRRFIPTGSAYFQLLCYVTYPVFFIASLFIPSQAKKLSNKLKFDFHSLVTALDTYVTNYDKWSYHEQDMAWMSVGKAQRDVPAHYAHEYCRPDRSFDPLPEFNEETLPRSLTFNNYVTATSSWFPLASSSAGLGFDFAVIRAGDDAALATGSLRARGTRRWAAGDLAAITRLDEVRTVDLTLSLEHLSPSAVARDMSL